MSSPPSLELYCDGCAEPSNPGPAGWGFAAFRDGQEIAHDYGGEPHASNNRMELLGLIAALDWIIDNAPQEPATVWSDSRYTVDGAMSWRHKWRARGWRRKGDNSVANLALWQEIDRKLTGLSHVGVSWCKGHAGNPGNERADELASVGRAMILPADGFLTADIGALDREYRRIMEGSL